MLDAIRGATRSINMELYIFQPGTVADQFIAALSERARHGVNVTIVVDAIGSFSLLRPAGPAPAESRVPHRVLSAAAVVLARRVNNRTHRELLIVDGRIAFAGGAGIADWWAVAAAAEAPTVARHDGAHRGAGRRRASGRRGRELAGVLRRDPDRPGVLPESRRSRQHDGVRRAELAGGSRDGVARDVSAADGRRRPRRADQHAVFSARPRAAARADRHGASAASTVSIIVPGRPTDQRWVRYASRRMWGRLLEAGIRIHEYRGAMMHAKVLIVDGEWAVLGTTNMDNRSFEHNDEVNVAMRDADVAARLLEDYRRDVEDSDEITLRSLAARDRCGKSIVGPFIWILERQQ